MALLVSALKKHDLPTLGSPTIPILRLLEGRPRSGLIIICFLGAIFLCRLNVDKFASQIR